MAPNIHTLNDITALPPQAKTFKDRHCPGMRSCWTFDVANFNPLNRDRDDTVRRTCMLVALGCHTALDAIALFLMAIHFDVIGLVIKGVLALIGFFFMAWCLGTIGNAEGERLVFGKMVGRWHFDIFLMFCAVVYGAALLGTIFGMGGISGFVLGLVPLPTWILIFGVAWVATWEASPTPVNLV